MFIKYPNEDIVFFLDFVKVTQYISKFQKIWYGAQTISTILRKRYCTFIEFFTHSQLLVRFKSESKYKIMEGGGVGACSLAHNILKGRGACWSFEMGLGRVDKLYSLTRAYTQPTQGG